MCHYPEDEDHVVFNAEVGYIAEASHCAAIYGLAKSIRGTDQERKLNRDPIGHPWSGSGDLSLASRQLHIVL